jgi:hypothetical protein
MRTAEALRHRAQEQFEEAVLYQSVQEAFIPFSTRFEGRVTHMYLDVKGLVTVGIGNLIDPVDLALALPFVHKQDESPATQDEIRAEWESLKADKDELAKAGWTACTPRTQLKLTDQDLDALVLSKAAQFEATLRSTTPEFASFDSWPADAQLGVLSMAWAMGPAFGNGWPNFRAAVATGDAAWPRPAIPGWSRATTPTSNSSTTRATRCSRLSTSQSCSTNHRAVRSRPAPVGPT